MKSEMQRLREYYDIPVKRGIRCRFRDLTGWRYGKVTSTNGCYIQIMFDDAKKSDGPYHPKDVEYLI